MDSLRKVVAFAKHITFLVVSPEKFAIVAAFREIMKAIFYSFKLPEKSLYCPRLQLLTSLSSRSEESEVHVFYCEHFLLLRITFVPLMDNARTRAREK